MPLLIVHKYLENFNLTFQDQPEENKSKRWITSWPQYTRVGFSNEPNVTHNDWYICSAVPSKNFPQPAINYI